VVLSWANLHGSFFLAPMAIGLATLDDLLRRSPGWRTMVAVLAASTIATCVTPFGAEVWGYAVGLSTNPTITRLISEWQRTSPLSILGVLFYGSVLPAAAVVVRSHRRGRKIEIGRALWLLALAVLGAYAERGVVWWALGAPVALAPLIASAFPALAAALPGREHLDRVEPAGLRRLNVVLVGGIVVAIVGLQPLWRPADPLTGPEGSLRDAPGGLARVLAARAGAADRVVVPQPWASWFEWAAPGRLVMVDSRIELFDDATWNNYLAISGGGAAGLAALDRIGATVVVVDPATQPALNSSIRGVASRWVVAFEDADGAVFVPRPWHQTPGRTGASFSGSRDRPDRYVL
jgi:hypothetical protein